MSILFKIIRDGGNYSATADRGPAFFVGRRVPYDGNIGLYNVFTGSRTPKINFEPANYANEYGFWVHFLNPTAGCEGRNFMTLNSYDRAAFTFGFGQFAAHVPNGDFVQYFRAMLQKPEAPDYFPGLAVVNNRICKVSGTAGPVPLENDNSTEGLMRYLNPTLGAVEDEEVIAAAKLIHWTQNHRSARLEQVEQMIDTYKSFMRRAQRRGLINGRSAAQCCVIADILHHGRGGGITWTLIGEALGSNDPFNKLIAIGAPRWDERKRTLKRLILADPQMQALHWSDTTGNFV
jgi:hypothetical protein